MHPKYKRKAAKAKAKAEAGKPKIEGDGEKEIRARKFPGLSMPDQEWKPEDEFLQEREGKEGKEAIPDFSMDDTMNQLKSAAARRNRPSADDFIDGEPSAKRSRGDDRSYSRERDFDDRSRGRGRDVDDRGGGIRDNGWAGRGGQGAAPPPRDGRGSSSGYRGRPGLDDQPLQYKIYNGTVSSVKDFGAFVSLEGVAGRTEGLVHVSNIASVRVNSPADVLSRGQPVKVKVMTVAGNKYGLSMKDVDQTTGEDLTPHLRIKSREEMEDEQRRFAARVGTGANAAPLRGEPIEPLVRVEEKRGSAKRLSSPERFEIKQLIASGAVSAADVSCFPQSQLTRSTLTSTMISMRRSTIPRLTRRSISKLRRRSRHSWQDRRRSLLTFRLSRSSRRLMGL